MKRGPKRQHRQIFYSEGWIEVESGGTHTCWTGAADAGFRKCLWWVLGHVVVSSYQGKGNNAHGTIYALT